MGEDWIILGYVIIVLSLSAIPLLLLFGWSIALCLKEMKEILIQRRNEYMENIRGIINGTTDTTICISGTTGLANATTTDRNEEVFSSEVV